MRDNLWLKLVKKEMIRSTASWQQINRFSFPYQFKLKEIKPDLSGKLLVVTMLKLWSGRIKIHGVINRDLGHRVKMCFPGFTLIFTYRTDLLCVSWSTLFDSIRVNILKGTLFVHCVWRSMIMFDIIWITVIIHFRRKVTQLWRKLSEWLRWCSTNRRPSGRRNKTRGEGEPLICE